MGMAVWPAAVLVAMAIRGRHHHRYESDSDRRSVELFGDPEALASALVKLHTLARIPRRWSPELERRATHPSLASRLRAIRALTGEAAGRPLEPVIVQGTDERTWVVIEPDRVRHLSGVPPGTPAETGALVAGAATAAALAYDQLTDLRVTPARAGGSNLHIATRAGRPRSQGGWAFCRPVQCCSGRHGAGGGRCPTAASHAGACSPSPRRRSVHG